MRNTIRRGILTLAAVLLFCLCSGSVLAEDWQQAYAQKLRGDSARRVAAFMQLTGSEAPEMAVISVDSDKKATIRLYRCKNGQAVLCDAEGFNPNTFTFSGYSSAKMQLRTDTKGNPCLQLSLKGIGSSAIVAFAGNGSGSVKTVYNIVKKGGAYYAGGTRISEKEYKKYQDAYNGEYVKKGAAVPVVSIASTAAKKTITQKVQNLAAKYQKYVTVSRVKLSKSELAMTTGKSVKLSAAFSPASAIFEDAEWSSSNADVAAVEQDGTVTAISAGRAVIFCKVGQISAGCQVTVSGETVLPTGVELNVSSATLIKGEKLYLEATPLPVGVKAKVKWSSSNPKVAVADSDGSVLAMSKGTAVIIAKTQNGKTAKCKIVVNNSAAVIVDISQHNAPDSINWEKVAASTNLLILRCGVTRTETKPLGIGKDDCFQTYAKKCQQYNIPFGVYYYGKCSSVEQAKEEARFTWEIASPYKPLFYVYDAEESRLNKAKIEAYMTTLQSLGAKKTGYYIAHNLYKTFNLDTSLVDFIWIPHYGKNNGSVTSTPSYACDLHQYTSQGTVSGFSGKVDVSRLMGGKTLSWFTSK